MYSHRKWLRDASAPRFPNLTQVFSSVSHVACSGSGTEDGTTQSPVSEFHHPPSPQGPFASFWSLPWCHYHKIHYLPLGMQYRDLTLLLLWCKLCTLRTYRVSFLKFKSCCKQKIFQTSFYWIVPFLRPFVIKWMKFEQSRGIDYEWKSQSIYWMFALSPSGHHIKELLTLSQMIKKLR